MEIICHPPIIMLTCTYPWADQERREKQFVFERRLELALEGHRFFDLVRWGIAADYMSTYLTTEKNRLPNNLTGVVLRRNKNSISPFHKAN